MIVIRGKNFERLPLVAIVEFTLPRNFSMPTVLRLKGYRFFFFSLEGNEPPHIHIEQAERFAKYWLNPVRLNRSKGFHSSELSEIREIVEEHQELLLSKWNEHFNRTN